MAKEILYGTECKHWKNCEFRNDICCDSEINVFEFNVFKSHNQKIGQFAQTKLGDFNA